MKKTWIYSLSHSLLLGGVLGISSGLIACQDQQNVSSPSLTSSQESLNLGTVQGELRLPQDQECSLFTAYQVDQEDALFSININQARVRDYRYSFLHTLPEGNYQVKGVLTCDSEEGPLEYDSLYDDVVIETSQTTTVQFRFFFDIESDLNQIDLKFCADLALRSLSPAFEACPGEHIQGQYDLEWLREDCGEVALNLLVEDHQYEGNLFTFPATEASVEGYAPNEEGEYQLTIALSSPEGGAIELYQAPLNVISCEDENNEDDEDEEDEDLTAVCDSEETLDDLLNLDLIYGDTTHLIQLVREIVVFSGSEDLSAEEQNELSEEISILISELSLYTYEIEYSPNQEQIDLSCNFSDLNGFCGQVDRTFNEQIPSISILISYLSEIDLNTRSAEENIAFVDQALSLSSQARNTLSALYERFDYLISQPINGVADLQNLSLDLVNRASEFAVFSQNETFTAQDRTFLNTIFTHLRDETVRIYECTLCDVELDESDDECVDGGCLSIETPEQARQAESILEEVAGQFNQCLDIAN